MRQSKLFSKTNKDAKQLASVNATLLQKAGFIDQTMAGVYTFLPLGLRVLSKIERIIREEMDQIGTELLMPALGSLELWEKTGRLESMDVLMKTVPANKHAQAKNDTEYVLNPTHEEIVTPLAKKFHYSYKDLPFAVYQIQTKFRNEPRPKSGLLRSREFRMKDLYSFHASEADFLSYYEIAKAAYTRVFERVGLGQSTRIVLASGGDFTAGFSHEFQTECSTGEDTIFYAAQADLAYNREVAPARCPDQKSTGETPEPLKVIKGQGIIGVAELAKFLGIPIQKTTKTILFETETGQVVAGVVRGDYDVSEYKLQRIVGCQRLSLASSERVKKVTGAQVGYAGPLNLPKEVEIYFDDSTRGRVNFECGANRTDHHTLNVNFGRDLPEPKEFFDIKIATEGDLYPETGERYQVYAGSEVGNIFPLNTKFSSAVRYTFSDKAGQAQPVYMGSYGIGSSRIMGVLAEKFHDAKGIVWPEQVAPFTAHLLVLGDDAALLKKAEDVYAELTKKGVDVLFDDRAGVMAGEKFADADLIGIPWRLVISKKTDGKIEIKKRDQDKTELLTLPAVVKQLAA